jgi:hypothetical protein
MIRINLLPPEIVQKRKDEKRWRWVAFGGVVAFVIVGLVFAVLQLQVAGKQYEVSSVRQQAEALKQKADKFKIFQDKKTDLETRKQIAAGALAGRTDWSKVLSEICLVLPSDIYLTRIGAMEPKMAPPTTRWTIPTTFPTWATSRSRSSSCGWRNSTTSRTCGSPTRPSPFWRPRNRTRPRRLRPPGTTSCSA